MECLKCRKLFKLKTDLQRHLDRKIKCDRILECKKCKKIFKTKQNLNSHINNKNSCTNISVETENKILKLEKELLESKLEKINLKNANINNTVNYKKPIKTVKNILENDIHFIYLLQERTAVESDINVYKIGKSTQENYKRFDSYHKGFKLLLHIKCDNSHLIETEIINKFKLKYVHYEKFGSEYFQGDYKEMMTDIIKLVL